MTVAIASNRPTAPSAGGVHPRPRLLIAPMRPGPNLVQLGGSGYPRPGSREAADAVAGALAPATGSSGHTGRHDMTVHGGAATIEASGDPVAFTSRPGARGGWAVLDIPAGTTSLTLRMGGDSATVPVDAGTGSAPPSTGIIGADGPECASAIVGAVLAGSPEAGTAGPCPSRSLDPAQAQAQAATLGGTFLAPWLLTGDVLRRTASAFLPLSFAPNEPDAQRYAITLARTYPDTAPSASGFLAWARTAGVPAGARPSLYGAAAVNVPMSVEPPGSAGHHGGPDPATWYPGGTVVLVISPMEPAGGVR